MPTTAKFNALMERVLSGSQSAAEELFRDYEPYLLKAIRRRLTKWLRPKFDSLDFAQDVWASFFAEKPGDRVFRNPDELVKFLTELARNKVVDAARQVNTKKHNVKRERSLDDSRRFNKNALRADQPTPSQFLMSQEEWAAFLRRQPLVYRHIFILLREGKTHAQIASDLGIDKKTVQRVILRYAPKGMT